MNNELRQTQLHGLGTLLQLEQEARHAPNRQTLSFLIVNDTRRLLEYDQALLFFISPESGVTLQAASSLAVIDNNAPFVTWIKKLVAKYSKTDKASKIHPINSEDVPELFSREWSEWITGNVLWSPFFDREGNVTGVLWISRESIWNDNEIGIIERISDAYSHAWQSVIKEDTKKVNLIALIKNNKTGYSILALFIAIMFIPVSQTVIAPAEIVPSNPFLITASMDGVIKNILIKPNRLVAAGTTVVEIDDTTIRNRYEIASQAMEVSRAQLLRASQKAFSDDKSKSEMAPLRAELQQKTAEKQYTLELLERTKIKTQNEGVAIFSDVDDWLGKPVIQGEKIMVIASPSESEIKIWLSVDDAIQMETGTNVRFYLNVNPTKTLNAVISQTSYEAQPGVTGDLAYVLRAQWKGNSEASKRIGMKGIAKLYGKKVSLFFYLFRRPVTAIRQWIGL